MPMLCSCCGHAQRTAIDGELEAGASPSAVAKRYGLNPSSVRRHKLAHVGRAVTFRIPPTRPAAPVATPVAAPPAPAPPVQSATAPPTPETPHVPAIALIDGTAALDRLFAQAAGSPDRALQDWLRLTLVGLGQVYAKADAIGDLSVATRALRELRALLQFHAIVEPAKLRVHAGWHEPPPLRDPILSLLGTILAETPEDAAQAEADYERDKADWRERGPYGRDTHVPPAL